MPAEYLTPAVEDRAVDVLTLLADLLIAATAELAGLNVLHLDRGFEIIAEITGQPPRASAGPCVEIEPDRLQAHISPLGRGGSSISGPTAASRPATSGGR
jgi:hypothetical protein